MALRKAYSSLAHNIKNTIVPTTKITGQEIIERKKPAKNGMSIDIYEAIKMIPIGVIK